MKHLGDLFFDKKHGEEYRDFGYTVVPLLDSADIDKLSKLHEALKKTARLGKQFYTSIWSDNEDHRRKADESIKDILFPALKTHLKDIQPVFANLMVKATGENSSLLPHQDWSFVDETEYDSATVWVPLVDVTPENGNLQVVPLSHLEFKNFVRPRFADAPFNREEISKRLVDISMKAGEALILNSRLIHASPQNNGNSERIAASVVIAPVEAKLKHWVLSDGKITELEIEQNFYWKYSCYDTLEALI